MGILDRIRKFFSRSGSSSNSRDPFRHGPTSHRNDGFNNVVQHSYQVQQNRHFNVSNIHTSSQRSANVRDKPSAGALHRTNTLSATTRRSNTQDIKQDADLKRANSCKGFTLPVLGQAVFSESNTTTNVSQYRCSTQSNKSKRISAEHSTTGGHCAGGNKTKTLNTLENTLKPEYSKQTANQRTLSLASSTGNAENRFSGYSVRG